VATWAELEASQPEFAGRVRKLMTTRKHLTMATLRRDGSPRISGTEVRFEGDDLRIGSMPGARKALDLRRDPRVAIHGPTHDPASSGRWRGEAKIAGRAVELQSSDDSHAFRIDIDEVVITHLNAAGDRLVIESWNPARGYRKDERA
jgi:Pyridoxamine 5'-phosphate oxidase